MYDELTKVDIRKMQEEIDHRIQVLRPKLLEEVKVARAFGDLSENFEYKAAKREKSRNESRIRYLERMIKTAKAEEIGLFDTVRFHFEENGAVKVIRLVTTLRQNALEGLVSSVSPIGKALMGRKAGDRVRVEVNPAHSYYIVVEAIQKGQDDDTLPISAY